MSSTNQHTIRLFHGESDEPSKFRNPYEPLRDALIRVLHRATGTEATEQLLFAVGPTRHPLRYCVTVTPTDQGFDSRAVGYAQWAGPRLSWSEVPNLADYLTQQLGSWYTAGCAFAHYPQ